jgi:2-(1,2-epoxy-1,2-dihydrophenyl)acetyl-CoA isomerase
MCDIRVANEDAIFPESLEKIGVSPDDGGASLVQRIAGIGKAAEMAFTGDPIRALEVLVRRLVFQVVPAAAQMDEDRKLAGQIAASPGHQLRRAKYLSCESQTDRLATIL